MAKNVSVPMKSNIPKEEYIDALLAGDIEGDNLYEKVTKLWCIVTINVETNKLHLFHNYPEYDNMEVIDPYDLQKYTIPARDGDFDEGVRFLYRAANNNSKIIMHNALKYDKPVLEKFYPKFKTKLSAWHDTLAQSKHQWRDRPIMKGAKSAHGLQCYGVRFGINKPEITDWSEMDEFKLHRCIEDVKIQVQTFKYLEAERKQLKEQLGIDLSPSFWEHEVPYAQNTMDQEAYGAMLDKVHAEFCVEDLDNKSEELAAKVEPQLPPTIKKKTGKIPRSEMAKLFGFKKIPPDVYITKTDKDGVKSKELVKQYYKPSTNFTRTIKGKMYSGIHESYGASPEYPKKKELTAWIKENHPDTKPKDWDIEAEETELVVLNKNTCDWFGVPETEYGSSIVGAHTRVEFLASHLTQHEVVKAFLVTLGLQPTEWNLKKEGGQTVRATENIDFRYPAKAAPEKQLVLKIKKGEPLVTSPKLTEDAYESLPEGVGLDIAHYNTYVHRRRFLLNPKDPDNKGLLAYVRPETGRIPCGVNNFGTSTGRAAHTVWVNAAGDGALYGKEIRQCIVAPDGKKLVGADMRSAQLSIAAYYANNTEYYNSVATGQEIKVDGSGQEIIHPDSGKPWYIGESGHCVNARAFTLVSDAEYERALRTQDPELIHHISLMRKKSKGGSFATIFGASGKRVAQTLGIPEELGEEKRNNFLTNIGLDNPIKILNKMVKKYRRAGGGYIELPMGYYVWCRESHKFFNYLDQGTEAVCQKIAHNYYVENAKKSGLWDHARIVVDYHDEMLIEADEDVVDDAGALLCKAYTYAGEIIWEWHRKNSKWFTGADLPDFCIDLAAGYKVGQNYYDVH